MDQQQPVATGRLTLDEVAVQDFTTSLRGEVLRPTDEGYDEARTIHNGMIDRRPTLIARCAGVADVMTSVQFARAQQLLVSVRCGGHNVAGFSVCDGGLMIDLSRMRSVRVDAARQRVRAEGGATWGDFDHETQAFGLATTGGIARPTGIAGLTRGGGGNFGIATSFEYQLHEVGPVLGGMLIYPLARAKEIFRIYRDVTSAAPDELSMHAILA